MAVLDGVGAISAASGVISIPMGLIGRDVLGTRVTHRGRRYRTW